MKKPIYHLLVLMAIVNISAFSQSAIDKIETTLEQKFVTDINRCHDHESYVFGHLNVVTVTQKKETTQVEGHYTFMCDGDDYFNNFKASLNSYSNDYLVTEIKTSNSIDLNNYWVVYPRSAFRESQL